jgi:hypothetical protein
MQQFLGYGYLGGSYYGTTFFFLLPFIEQQNLWNFTYNEDVANGNAWVDPWIYTAYISVVKTYICPSDPTVQGGLNNNAPYAPAGACSYAVNALAFGQDQLATPPLGYVVSRLAAHNHIPASFPDGTSNTILFTEKYTTCGPIGGSFWGDDGEANAYIGVPPSSGSPIPPAFVADRHTDNWTPLIGLAGYPSFFQVQPTQATCNFMVPQSGHTAVILTALADGSVRTVSQGISSNTWWLGLVPNDGQPMPSDW